MVTTVHDERVSAKAIACVTVLILNAFAVTPAQAATFFVNAGGDLQAALNAAQPGDEIVLAAGARFTGSFRLPVKPSGPVITIRSSAPLPARRLTPGDAALLPTLVSGSPDTTLTGEGTSNWRLDGLRFESTTTGEGHLIGLQNATNITMDRLLIVAGSQGQKRGIMGNGRHITLTRSHIANIWRSGQDSQAFCAWDGAGPYTVTDNYLEAASENVMFGGANSQSPSHVPSDILVEGNHFSKRLEWKGQPRNVKNLFELKSAKRVVVRNNLFERNWTDGQNGYAILFSVRNDEGGSPWSVVEDVLFERNIIRDTENVFNVHGYDMYQPSMRSSRITIRQNLALSSGTFLQVGGELGTLALDHNTVANGWTFALLYYGDVWVAGTAQRRQAAFAVEDLKITNTLAYHREYGLIGEGAGIGTPGLAKLTKTYTWTHNVLAGEQGWGHTYPPVTWQPSLTEHQAQFTTAYALVPGSGYRGAGNDGLDLGVVWDSPSPTPPPTQAEICGDGIDNDGDGQIDEGCSAPAPAPAPAPEPAPAPSPALDTTGPEVTFALVLQNPVFYRFRLNGSDPSGIASVRVWFDGTLVRTATALPVEVEITIRGLKAGTYPLTITVADGVGNATTLNRTVPK